MKTRWIRAALSLLGFGTVACNSNTSPLVMYGTPHVDLSVEGRVADVQGNVIEGIQVVVASGQDNASTLTMGDGRFEIKTSAYPTTPQTLTLRFQDIDGALNGTFDPYEKQVTFTEANRTKPAGDDGWFKGSFGIDNIEIALEGTE